MRIETCLSPSDFSRQNCLVAEPEVDEWREVLTTTNVMNFANMSRARVTAGIKAKEFGPISLPGDARGAAQYWSTSEAVVVRLISLLEGFGYERILAVSRRAREQLEEGAALGKLILNRTASLGPHRFESQQTADLDQWLEEAAALAEPRNLSAIRRDPQLRRAHYLGWKAYASDRPDVFPLQPTLIELDPQP